MSLVVFPFKDEGPSLVASNVQIAAAHPRIDEVWAVAAEEEAVMGDLPTLIDAITSETSTPVHILVQDRIGTYRAGKGDAMNTAIHRAAGEGRQRVHFYDADITNFDASWIEGAEQAADRGYGAVRHRFPRASTDAMITWMITRPSLAMHFPGTFLPRINQPLGGEILVTGDALKTLAASPDVAARSDWGIDTLITYQTAANGSRMYEHHVADGKRHTLYGSLAELKTMVIECLDAAASLQSRPGPAPKTEHHSDPPAPVPLDLKKTVAYDFDSSLELLTTGWSAEEAALAATLPEQIANGILANRHRPTYAFLDADSWYEVLAHLHSRFRITDPAWEALAFRLWLARVLAYSTNQAQEGFDRAMDYLEGTIRGYEQLSLGGATGR